MRGSLEDTVRNLLSKTPWCCKGAAVQDLQERLRQRGMHQDAARVQQIVARLTAGRLAQTRSARGPRSKHVQGAPASFDKYYESCMRKYKGDEARCKAVATKIVCAHVSQNDPFCQ